MNHRIVRSVEEGRRAGAEACEHVEHDAALAHLAVGEEDGFGLVDLCLLCRPCYEADRTVAQNEEYVCHDCGKTFPLKTGVLWRWYDFYTAQGDEPLPICGPCSTGSKHQARVAKDAQTAQAEDELYRRYDD